MSEFVSDLDEKGPEPTVVKDVPAVIYLGSALSIEPETELGHRYHCLPKIPRPVILTEDLQWFVEENNEDFRFVIWWQRFKVNKFPDVAITLAQSLEYCRENGIKKLEVDDWAKEYGMKFSPKKRRLFAAEGIIKEEVKETKKSKKKKDEAASGGAK